MEEIKPKTSKEILAELEDETEKVDDTTEEQKSDYHKYIESQNVNYDEEGDEIIEW